MKFESLQKNWNEFAKTDPLWAILTEDGKKGNKWQTAEFFETGVLEIEKVLQQLAEKNITIERHRALDFGCGVGRLTQALANHFDEVWGVDIAPAMIEQANLYNKHSNKCRFIVNKKNVLSIFDECSFDFLYTNIVLQHMRPKYAKKYIREFIRVIKPNGIAVFQLPSERIRSLAWYKRLLRLVLTDKLIDQLFYLRISIQSIFHKGPVMEMYAIKKEDLIHFIKENNARIMHIQVDSMNHGNWQSYIYFIQKKI